MNRSILIGWEVKLPDKVGDFMVLWGWDPQNGNHNFVPTSWEQRKWWEPQEQWESWEQSKWWNHRNNEKKHSDWLRGANRGNDGNNGDHGNDGNYQLCMKPTGLLVIICLTSFHSAYYFCNISLFFVIQTCQKNFQPHFAQHVSELNPTSEFTDKRAVKTVLNFTSSRLMFALINDRAILSIFLPHL